MEIGPQTLHWTRIVASTKNLGEAAFYRTEGLKQRAINLRIRSHHNSRFKEKPRWLRIVQFRFLIIQC